MRALFTLLFLVGAFTMSESAVAEEPKKDEKKSPSLPSSYDEKVTVRKWNEETKKFLKPIKDVPALRSTIDGKMVIYTMPPAANAFSPKGSEITDKDGKVWVVEKAKESSTHHINYVIPKPADK